MRLRNGDQPLPVVNDGPCIQDLVTQDIATRKAVGQERYGTTLQPFNGRDALRDAYEEALDLAMYLRQEIWERDHLTPSGTVPRERVSYYCGHSGCRGYHDTTHEVCC